MNCKAFTAESVKQKAENVNVLVLSQVMQHPTDGAHILCLHSNLKDASVRAAELSVLSLSSQPIEQEDTSGNHDNKTKASGKRTGNLTFCISDCQVDQVHQVLTSALSAILSDTRTKTNLNVFTP